MTTPMLTPPASRDEHWEIDAVVAELRVLRDASLAARQRSAKPAKLPARKTLAAIIEALSAALFPNRLGSRELANESVDYFVGHTLDMALRQLVEQVLRELQFAAGDETGTEVKRSQARQIVRQFAAQLPGVRRLLESDLQAAFASDPAARSLDEVLVCYPGITAILHHRLAHLLHQLGAPLVARIIAEIAHSLTGIDIHPGAQIEESFFIDHGTGVVIGATTIIGKRVRLYHGVTLGAKSFPCDDRGDLIKDAPRHPIVEDDVVIYAGATILGRITLGRGSVIGGNVWLTRSVPAGSSITQARVRTGDEFSGGSGI